MAKTFNSVAEFKRVLAVGDKLKATYHLKIEKYDENNKAVFIDEDKGIREVSVKQTNSFALKTLIKGEYKDSWCQYPKASEAKVENGKIVIYQKDMRQFPGGIVSDRNPDYVNLPLIPVLTYEFVD